jgi:hypothetical protein
MLAHRSCSGYSVVPAVYFSLATWPGTSRRGKEELWRQWMCDDDASFAADHTRERADAAVDAFTAG